MFKGRIAKVEIDYIPPSATADSSTRLNLKGVSGNILENDAYIRSVTGLDSVGFETLGGALSVGGSAYTGARAHDREIVFTLECYILEDGFRNKVNNLKLLQDEGPLYFRVTSTEGSMLHTYGYITELVAPPFRKEREIQLTFKSPSPYFVEKPIVKSSEGISRKQFTYPLPHPPLKEYDSDFPSYTSATFDIDFSDSEISQKTDIKLAFETTISNPVGFSFASSGPRVKKTSALRPSTYGSSYYYDSMENRINNHHYSLEGEKFETPVDAPDLTDYGNPKPIKDINTLIKNDWSIAYSTTEWPTPSLVSPKFIVMVYTNTSYGDDPKLKYRAVIYNKVLGI